MARLRRLFNLFVDKKSFLDAFSSWQKYLNVDSVQSAITLALHILLSHCEAGQRGYSEIFLVDPSGDQSAPISTDEILWEYGEKRFKPQGDVSQISFLLPPAYVYYLMPAMMRYLGVEDPETVLFFGLSLLELYAYAIKSGLCVVMYNPVEDSRLIIEIVNPDSSRELRFWPLYIVGENAGREPSWS